MGVKPAVFQSGGQASQHYVPGAFSRLDFVASGNGFASINNAVILGDSRGGEPGRLMVFGSVSEARAVLRSGPLLDAVIEAFNPGGGAVPQQIGAVRVNTGVQASRMLKNGVDDMVKLTAWDWGLHGNQVQTKLEAGTDANTKKVSVVFQNQTAQVIDNVGRASFSIQYTGGGSACVMNITGTDLTTTVTGGTENLSIDLESFPTIENLVNYLNNQAGYAAAIVTGNPAELTVHLDAVTGAGIKANPYTARSDLQAIIEAFASVAWIGNVEFVGTARRVPGNDAGWVFMTGGDDGSYTLTEWESALLMLESEDVQFVGSSSPTESVHLLIKAHCEKMCSVMGKGERQYILGGAAGETVDQVLVRAKNLGRREGALCYPGIKVYDSAGNVVTRSPVFYAAKELGRQTTLALNEPATNKDVAVLDFEKTLTNAEQEKLIKGGVWCGAKTRNGRFINVRSITTTQTSLLQEVEFSMMREALFASRDLRDAIEAVFIGRPGTKGRFVDIDATFALRASQYTNNLQIFVNKPTNYLRRVVGDQVIIEYDADLVSPINFTFITAHFKVFADTTQG